MFLRFQERQQQWQDTVLAMPPLLRFLMVLLAVGAITPFGLVANFREISVPSLLCSLCGIFGFVAANALMKRKLWSRTAIAAWFLGWLATWYFLLPLPEGCPPALWNANFVLNLVFSVFIVVYLFRSKRVDAYFSDA